MIPIDCIHGRFPPRSRRFSPLVDDSGASPFLATDRRVTNGSRLFSPRIDDLLTEVAVSSCRSTTPIELTHGLRHFSQADRGYRTLFMTRLVAGIFSTWYRTVFMTRLVAGIFSTSRNNVDRRVTNGLRRFSPRSRRFSPRIDEFIATDLRLT